MLRHESLTPAHASELLLAAGFGLPADALEVEAHDERWLVRLPGWRLASFAASESGRNRLLTERRVLRLLEARCSFSVPRVLFGSAELDVRSMVPGMRDPWRMYDRLRGDAALAGSLGAALGSILAEQHTRIRAEDVAGWLPHRPSWPEPRDWIRERLPGVVADRELIARAEAVIDAYEQVSRDVTERVLVHADLGLHNLGIDAQSFALNGVFDYGGAAWADRHHDFRYLVFDFGREEMLEKAAAVYEATVGRTILRGRVFLYNAACAICFLAYRAGVAPEVAWCGRTLEQDVRWSTQAIDRALSQPDLDEALA